MKTLSLIFLIFLSLKSSLYSLDLPVSPMDNYTPTEHTLDEVNKFYNILMKGELKGDDCFKRAYIWSYQLHHFFGVKSLKVFFHYTDRFNKELDQMGTNSRVGRWLNGGSSFVWDFHVAPAVKLTNGEIMVLDPTVFPSTKRPMTLKEWVDGLKKRGEYYLKKRKEKLIDQLERAERRYYSALNSTEYSYDLVSLRDKINEIVKEMQGLGLTRYNQNISELIQCKQIEHIMTFDQEQDTQWCHYQLSSMYYYATGELRALNYGPLHYDPSNYSNKQSLLNTLINEVYRWPVNRNNLVTAPYFERGESLYQDDFFAQGADLFQVYEFRNYYIERSLDEIEKKYRPEFSAFLSNPVAIDPEEQRRLERERREEQRRREIEEREREREIRRLERIRRREQRRRERELRNRD